MRMAEDGFWIQNSLVQEELINFLGYVYLTWRHDSNWPSKNIGILWVFFLMLFSMSYIYLSNGPRIKQLPNLILSMEMWMSIKKCCTFCAETQKKKVKVICQYISAKEISSVCHLKWTDNSKNVLSHPGM